MHAPGIARPEPSDCETGLAGILQHSEMESGERRHPIRRGSPDRHVVGLLVLRNEGFQVAVGADPPVRQPRAGLPRERRRERAVPDPAHLHGKRGSGWDGARRWNNTHHASGSTCPCSVLAGPSREFIAKGPTRRRRPPGETAATRLVAVAHPRAGLPAGPCAFLDPPFTASDNAGTEASPLALEPRLIPTGGAMRSTLLRCSLGQDRIKSQGKPRRGGSVDATFVAWSGQCLRIRRTDRQRAES